MSALGELITRYGVDVAPHLDRDADIPVLTKPQIQGDVSIRPVRRRLWGRRFYREWIDGRGWVSARWVRPPDREREFRRVRSQRPAITPVPPEGVVVSTGSEGHEHRLLPGPAWFDPVQLAPAWRYLPDVSERLLLIGILTVPAGCEQYLAHDEHGYLGIGPGTYEVGRQREWTPSATSTRAGSRWGRILD
jgi:hypothetical protein